MQRIAFRSALLAAAVGFSSLAFAATAQTTGTPPPFSPTANMPASASSSGWMHHGNNMAASGSSSGWMHHGNNMAASGSSSGWMHHGMKHGMEHRGFHHGEMGMWKKLDLTDTQRNNIQQMMRQERTQAQPQMKDLMQKRMAFENATPGSSEYRTAADQLEQAEAHAARERVTRQADMRTKIYNMLTPEQHDKLASLRSERQSRMQNMHNRHTGQAWSHSGHTKSSSATSSAAHNATQQPASSASSGMQNEPASGTSSG
ncbi:MAG: Spy/CpxP family protein refolding chaperone [Rhodanobacteraceae bacterium]